MLRHSGSVIPNVFANYRSHDKDLEYRYGVGEFLFLAILPINW